MMSNNNRYHEGELSDIEIDGLSIGSTDSEATFANAAVRRTPKRLEPSLNNGPSWLSMPLDTQDFYASLPPVGPLFPDADIRQYHTFTSGSSNENQQPPRSRTGSVTSTTSGRLRSQRSISPKRKREQGLNFSRMETSSPPGDVSPVSSSSRGSRRGSVVAPSKPFEVADLEAVTHLLGIKRRSFSPLTPNTTAALAPQPIATSKPASPRGAKSTTPSMIITLQPVSGGAVRQVPLNTKPTADPELELRRFQGLASMLYKRKTSSASQAPSLSGEDSSTEMR